MNMPPSLAIEAARASAVWSPCAKSKRGASLFCVAANGAEVLVAVGFNGQPEGFSCTGTEACRRDCAKLCVHAEQRALQQLGCDDRDGNAIVELVHVKVVDGLVVSGGPPSCWQCSRLVVEAGIRGVWLFETIACPSDDCAMCIGLFCNACSPADLSTMPCEHASDERHRGMQPPRGEWNFYTATEFHTATLRECKLEHNTSFVELAHR